MTQDLFSGTWILNPAKSAFDPNHRPTQATMRFERNPEGYRMTASGTKEDGQHVEERPQTIVLDGKEHEIPGVPNAVAIAHSPDPHTIRAMGKSGNTVLGEGSYVVSADGKTLTATTAGTDAQQRRFQTVTVWERE
jgi:hypothetical protein